MVLSENCSNSESYSNTEYTLTSTDTSDELVASTSTEDVNNEIVEQAAQSSILNKNNSGKTETSLVPESDSIDDESENTAAQRKVIRKGGGSVNDSTFTDLNSSTNHISPLNLLVPPPAQFCDATNLWNYWKAFKATVPWRYFKNFKNYQQGRVEAVVNEWKFIAETSLLLRMECGLYCDKIMDNGLQLLLKRSGSRRAHIVIPTGYATECFYAKTSEDVTSAINILNTGTPFVSALHVHSSIDCAAPDHWIFFSRGPIGIYHVYDSFGKEKLYKQILRANISSIINGGLNDCKFDDDPRIRNNTEKKTHPTQQDDNNCGPLVLQEAERWLQDSKRDILTDPESCKLHRINSTNLFLQTTVKEELIRYCVNCNTLIENNCKCLMECCKCNRYMHANCCTIIFATTTPYSCCYCQSIPETLKPSQCKNCDITIEFKMFRRSLVPRYRKVRQQNRFKRKFLFAKKNVPKWKKVVKREIINQKQKQISYNELVLKFKSMNISSTASDGD